MEIKFIISCFFVLFVKLYTAEEIANDSTRIVIYTKTCTTVYDLAERLKCENDLKKTYYTLLESEKKVSVPNVCNSKQNSGCFADPNGNIDCTQNVTEVVCKCPAGYIDIGSSTNVSGIFCQDIDECLEETDKCASHGSKCTNTIGSYKCSCLENYFGNGKECDAVDVCLKKPCPANSKCENIDKYRGCFKQSIENQKVVNVKEMNADDCIKHCRKNSFELAFVKNNKCSCENKIRATEVDKNNCNTTCFSNNQKCGGLYDFVSVYQTGELNSCRCLEGFVKKNEVCVDVNECNVEGVCPSNSVCVNKEGSYSCKCDDGFIMTSNKECKQPIVKHCESFTHRTKQIRENLELWYNCDTVVLLDCNYRGESYMEDGDVFYFVEKGKFGTCKKGVLEYDENSVNVNEGSTSDFYSADVTCQSNEKLVVKINKFVLNSKGFNKSNIFIGPHDLSVNEALDLYGENPSCKPKVIYEHGAFYKFVVNKGECGLSYINDVKNRKSFLKGHIHGKTDKNGHVSKISKVLNVDFTCSYKNDGSDLKKEKRALKEKSNLTTKVIDAKPIKKKNNFAPSLDESLTFRHKLEWINAGDIVPLQLTSVIVTPHTEGGLEYIKAFPGQKVQLHMSISGSDFVIQPVRCWVEDSNIRNKHIVVKNGCNSYTASKELSVKFEPVSFKGGVIEKQDLSCFVKLCNKKDNCLQECNAILEGGAIGMEMNWSTKMLSASYNVIDDCGPKHKGGCDHYCTTSISNGAVCSCEENFVLVENKHCEVIIGGVLNAQQPWILQITIILVVVFIFLIVVCYITKKKMEAKNRHQKYSFARDEQSDLGEVVNNTILQ